MTDKQVALARHAVMCRRWRWVAGMKIHNGSRVTESLVPFMFPVDTPDLTDRATLGCLLGLVREALSDPYACVVGDPETGWRIDAVTAHVQDLHSFNSEEEVLVAALWSES